MSDKKAADSQRAAMDAERGSDAMNFEEVLVSRLCPPASGNDVTYDEADDSEAKLVKVRHAKSSGNLLAQSRFAANISGTSLRRKRASDP
eukprot:scaffold274210_cov56-Prasinocladus_malaysianus.AAC.1